MYLIALLAGIPAIVWVWLLKGATDPFIRYAYPFLMGAAALWLVGLRWKRVPLSWTEYCMQTSVALFFFAKYVYFLFFHPDIRAAWQEVEAVFWVISMIYIIGYILADHHFALRLSIAYSVLTTALGFLRLWNQDTALLLELVRLETRVVAISFLAFILAKVKDALASSQRERNVMEELANTDYLTRLPNRRSLTNSLTQRLKFKKPFALLLIDIDHFKRINDEHGHEIGDLVLSKIGHAIRAHQRPGDSVARWGGEEFVVLMEETEKERALLAAERLRLVIESLCPEDILVTISIGGTLRLAEDTLESLFQRADASLYAAKSHGRNGVVWSD
ncbi:MAG: GGDEF domain-containing protein [Anaerolineales bacterium]